MHAVAMLFLVALLPSPAPPAVQKFPETLARFHVHYDQFLRAYLGCPKGATGIAQCEPGLGTFDYLEFNRAAREARELFSLEKK